MEEKGHGHWEIASRREGGRATHIIWRLDVKHLYNIARGGRAWDTKTVYMTMYNTINEA